MARRSRGSKPDPRLVDPRSRVVLPEWVRRHLCVETGDFVQFEVDPSGVVRVHKLLIEPEPPKPP